MRKIAVLINVLLLCVTAARLSADELLSSDIPTQKLVLESGLTVLVSEMPLSPTVSVFGLVKTGSATEGKYLGAGISHFLEHMLFKGTHKRGVGEISRQVQALGGSINASTSFDYTIYTITVPDGSFDEALDILADMFMRSKFEPVEIDKEREVVYGEMRLYRDRPERYLSQMVFDAVYKQHPYGIPIIGHRDLLARLSHKDFVDYYRTHYTANNTVLSIAGNVKAGEILEKVRVAFADYPRQNYVPRNLVPEPPQISPRYYEEEYPTDMTRMSIVYPSVSLLSPDMVALDVLAMVLGQGESSRIYKELFIKRGLVRSVHVSNYTPLDPGIFEVESVLDEKDLPAVIDAVKQEIQDIIQKGVNPKELDRVKRQALAAHVKGRITSDAIAYDNATDEAFTADHEFSRKYVQAIKKVSSDDLKRVARQYLTDDRMSVIVLKPKRQAAEVPSDVSNEQPSKIEKVVFGNGLTVLLRENRAFPIVALNVVLNGGLGQETTENNGISNLLSAVWAKGTQKRDAQAIAETLESLGAQISPFSGRNSMGLQLSFLSEDMNVVLDLLEDVIKNPTFSDQQITLQKDKIKTAIISMEDQISAVTARHLRETLLERHPYRMDTIGTLQSVQRLTREDLRQYYRQAVVPNNMVISVFGDIDAQAVLQDLQNRFGNLTQGSFEVKTNAEPPPDKTRQQKISPKKEQAMVMLGYQGADLKSADRDAIEVMAAVLGSPFNGRIFKTVRDDFGHAYTLGGGYTPGRDLGVISFYALTSSEKVDEVRKLLLFLIDDLAKNGITDAELNDFKKYLIGSFKMGIQTDASLSMTAALDELYGSGYDRYLSFEQRIMAVNAAQVQDMARKYLDIKKAAIVVARPKDDKSQQGEQPPSLEVEPTLNVP